MKKLFILMLLLSTFGCGRLSTLLDLTIENQQKQLGTPTPAPTANVSQNVSPEKPGNQTVPELKIELVNHDAILTWNNVGANSYTVLRCWSSPQYEKYWNEIATTTGFNMIFFDAYSSGTHYYKVRANFDNEITKTSEYKAPILSENKNY